jgi:hypothetical protein
MISIAVESSIPWLPREYAYRRILFHFEINLDGKNTVSIIRLLFSKLLYFCKKTQYTIPALRKLFNFEFEFES